MRRRLGAIFCLSSPYAVHGPNAFAGLKWVQAVVFRFIQDRISDKIQQVALTFSIAQGGLDIGFLIGKKAPS